ncbi:hypothetical protein GDO86_015073 [Hymenochirus boettgeri]|uniref:Uncharacterized protein n=1 Tax=Hymenochirus boettgeri TaxID=247094 RepID=A0A8T2JX90_9PIPI|nr:hypothetical protein GDO86_015073 [Hymenochirus boettgeri]
MIWWQDKMLTRLAFFCYKNAEQIHSCKHNLPAKIGFHFQHRTCLGLEKSYTVVQHTVEERLKEIVVLSVTPMIKAWEVLWKLSCILTQSLPGCDIPGHIHRPIWHMEIL